MYKIIFIFILILIIIYFFIKNYKIKFLSKTELENFLILNLDNYYNTFNINDYKVRNINSIEEYNNKIKQSCININNLQKEILKLLISDIDNKLKNYSIIGFNGNKCNNIQWIIGLIHGKLYEEGLPHTRNNIIIIPDILFNNLKQLKRILLHEKIHIYQKMFPKDIELYCSNNGYKKKILKNKELNIRANPDLDNWIYINKDNQTLQARYINNPKSINDVIINIDEHPFEKMAYYLENLVN